MGFRLTAPVIRRAIEVDVIVSKKCMIIVIVIHVVMGIGVVGHIVHVLKMKQHYVLRGMDVLVIMSVMSIVITAIVIRKLG